MTVSHFHIVLSGAFLLEAAGYLAFPYLAVGLRDTYGLAESRIGLVFLVATGLRPLWAVLGGYLGERVRPVILFAAACLAEGVAFLLLGTSTHVIIGVFAIILGNLGFSLWTPNLFALVYKSFDETTATAKVSLLNGVLNAGAAVGCLVGASFALFDMRYVFLGAAALYFAALPILARVLASEKVELSRDSETPVGGGWCGDAFAYVGLALTTAGFWASYSQFNSYFALYAKDWLGSSAFTGAAFGLVAVSVAIFSLGLSRWKKLRAGLDGLSTAALLLLCPAWLLLGLNSGLTGAVIFVLALAFGEAVLSVLLVERWAALNRRRNHVTQSLNFAVRNIAMGFGSLIGGYAYVAPGMGTGLGLWAGENILLILLGAVGIWLAKVRMLAVNPSTGGTCP